MPSIHWIRPGDEPPPLKERLLLIVDVASNPPDAQLMVTSEVVIGYWNGTMFYPMMFDPQDFGPRLNVRYWAKISHILPEEIALHPNRRFD